MKFIVSELVMYYLHNVVTNNNIIQEKTKLCNDLN